MEQTAIQFEGVSKRFDFASEEPDSVFESIAGVFSRKKKSQQREFWAVQDVSFNLNPGECLGIIGRNGSGKSTILKLASGIIKPTSGRVFVKGRLSALLELGAGFHTDLTGKENVYLNASILGMSQEDTNQCFEDIVEFSELGEFIHMPVKHYSSGMYMRLGFSVAVHVRPNILIVDEILAVGDQSFQIKCVDRIYELKNKGTTIVFVSHNLETVRNLCSKLMWLDQGKLMASGNVNEVISEYRQHLFERDSGVVRSESDPGEFRRWGSGEAEITAVRFLDDTGAETKAFQAGDELTIEIAYSAHRPISEPEFGLAIFRSDGIHVCGPNNRLGGQPIDEIDGNGVVRYRLDELILLPATYRVSVAIHDSRMSNAYDFHEQAYTFQVLPGGPFAFEGLVDMPASWEWQEIEEEESTSIEISYLEGGN
jgi:lipopolysaccharide transport system ATP-binding protein